jgi:C4-dicarboxylate-specific signal transduction histidine kinase
MYSLKQKKKENPEFHPILSVSTRRENNTVVLRIEDNGMGIPENIQKEIFKPFFTTKPTGEGTGLGLSLSNTIMQSQDGLIELQESSSEKTVFRLTFAI